jgi:hypothetical protein
LVAFFKLSATELMVFIKFWAHCSRSLGVHLLQGLWLCRFRRLMPFLFSVVLPGLAVLLFALLTAKLLLLEYVPHNLDIA